MTLGSFRKFQADDYLMTVVLCFYTTLIVTINIVRHTSSNLLPPGYPVSSLTPQDKATREFGSKLILVVEQCQCVTIWGTKISLILLYLRITTVHRENLAVKVLLGYVIGTFIIMDILYFGVWCQPFHNYWVNIAEPSGNIGEILTLNLRLFRLQTHNAMLRQTTSSRTPSSIYPQTWQCFSSSYQCSFA